MPKNSNEVTTDKEDKKYVNRARVPLSANALGVIENDCCSFAENEPLKNSSLICRVFLLFAEQSAAMIVDLDKYTEMKADLGKYAEMLADLGKYTKILRNTDKYADILEILNKYTDTEMKADFDKYGKILKNPDKYADILEILNKYTDDELKNYNRINELKSAKAAEGETERSPLYLTDDFMDRLNYPHYADVIEKVFKGSHGRFIKTVIEEYAKKPYFERELIYYSKIANEISYNLDKTLNIVTGKDEFTVKPYEIKQDKHSFHNYLTCQATTNLNDPFRAYSFRISRIKSVTLAKRPAPKLTKNQIAELEKEIMEKGVEYLSSGGAINVKVKFSKDGVDLFNKIMFQRPRVNSIDIKNDVYYFKCTYFQAKNFFFKFGEDAEIIEPKKLRDDFAMRYRNAAKKYETAKPHRKIVRLCQKCNRHKSDM